MKKSFLFLFLLSFPAPIWAITQIDIDPDPDEGWTGRMGVSIAGQTGNTDEEDYEIGLLVRHRRINRVWLALGNWGYGKTNGRRDEDNGMAHLRRIQRNLIAPNWDVEGFVQAAYDKFKDLRRRELVGGGVRWRLHPGGRPNEGVYSFFGLGAFFEDEESESRAADDSGFRGNFYNRTVWDRSEARYPVSFFATAYVQPKLDDVNDVRATASAGLDIPVSRRFSLSLAYELDYDSEPFPGVDETDTEYNINFNYDF